MDVSLNRGSQGGEFDNRAIVLKLAKLRAERATLLGYANYAAYSLEDQTAKTTTAVNTFACRNWRNQPLPTRAAKRPTCSKWWM